MEVITPVILCGGGGTRLWPFSQRAKPKPFLPLVGDQTLFQQAISRVCDQSLFAAPVVVGGAHHRDFIEQQIGDLPDWGMIVEPAAQNTAPAIALAAQLLPADAIIMVCPSDQHVANREAFRRAACAAAELARQDYLVSFGIAPDRPETGFGYIERGDPLADGFTIRRFVEKPDAATAEQYIASGDFSWNGGVFVFRAGFFLSELAAHRPDMARLVAEAVAGGVREGKVFHPAAAPFAAIAAESIDYAVMENTRRAAMVDVDMGWSDIGNWAALGDALQGASDHAGNIVHSGSADFDQCEGVLAVSDGPRISAVGLKDVVIVVHQGEVLVTTRDGAQRVGKLPGASSQ